MTDRSPLPRRRVLQGLVGAGTVALAGCANLRGAVGGEPTVPDPRAPPEGPADVSTRLRAGVPDTDSTAGVSGSTWLYDDTYPGPELRVSEGDVFEVDVHNDLPDETTIHWHGIPLTNPMDGVPNVTQAPIDSGEAFTYKFRAEPAGTYFYHSHVGLQLDRGLFGPLVIEEPSPHVEYDREFTVVFDDYLGRTPAPLSEFASDGTSDGGGTGGMGSGGMGGGPGGMMGGSSFANRPPYRALTVNGASSESPPTFEVDEGDRVRFRFVNASSATAIDVQLAGHPLSISHADGRPVEPFTVDAFGFGSGERYDAVVEANDPGTWELRGTPIDGDEPPARAVFTYGADSTQSPTVPSSTGTRLSYSNLRARSPLDGVQGSPDRTFDVTLSAGDSGQWLINGQAYPDADPMYISEGDHVRINMSNRSPVLHPMHLHGHFFQVGDAVKDTVVVPGHMGQVTIDFVADNPGDWFFHCHNLYHLDAGMARVIRYVE
ncbi:Multicopper oxidase [Halanaeroarchaeum sp. HSR-CO]|uniref:multicopper oxidase family protein n=1 Tax=Halanaeroarchaeum sp. HSR-CO TaxID=2866382 RepID=UPI00217E2C27|nr:multicopper oxidase family protein [Halanaeroarchaeum sp. HSR-CO]UWG47886.1 Multicopper oxidase [Halanaeroarchaeum sp. HSR-CO]